MRGRVILLISLGLNCALGIYLYYSARQLESDGQRLPARRSRAEIPTNNVKTRVLIRQQFFSWSEIESPDYAVYIANLRAIDCPEPTIRDIIVADVDELFAQKRLQVLDTRRPEWWRSITNSQAMQASVEKLHSLEAERRHLLTELLGTNWDGTVTTNGVVPHVVDLTGPVLSVLAPEVKDAVQEITAHGQQQQQEYVEAQQEAGEPIDPVELARLRQQTRGDLARVLNASQLEEYLLRYSDTAATLRTELSGFGASADEFRQVFRIRDAYQQQMDLYYSGEDAASVKKRQELEQQQNADIKQALGPDRFALYVLNQDPAFRAAEATAQQYGAPADKVMPVYQINQATLAEQQRINNDPSLTPDQKEQALLAARLEQQQSIRRVLNPAAYPPTPQAATPPTPRPPFPPLPPNWPRP